MDGHSPSMQRVSTLARAQTEGGLAESAGTAASTSAFAEVYEAHFDFVWRSARRLGIAEESVDDVVQDVFVTAYRRLDSFEGRSELRTWLFGILRRVVKDRRRSRARKPTQPLSVEPSAPSDESPAREAEQAQARRMLHAILDTLDDEQREVFVLAELEQMSAPEIAEATGVNLNTVYSRLRAARLRFEREVGRVRAREQWRSA